MIRLMVAVFVAVGSVRGARPLAVPDVALSLELGFESFVKARVRAPSFEWLKARPLENHAYKNGNLCNCNIYRAISLFGHPCSLAHCHQQQTEGTRRKQSYGTA